MTNAVFRNNTIQDVATQRNNYLIDKLLQPSEELFPTETREAYIDGVYEAPNLN